MDILYFCYSEHSQELHPGFSRLVDVRYTIASRRDCPGQLHCAVVYGSPDVDCLFAVKEPVDHQYFLSN